MILLVSGVMIGYVFYNTYYGTSYQLGVFHIRVIDAVRNIIEDFKSYLKLSLTYSSQQSLREHACSSGLIGAGPWICNGPNPVEVDQSKECLEKYTKYYFNVYTSLFNTSLPVQLSKINFTGCVYDVNSSDVFSEKYDEGLFWVNCSGAKIAVTGTNVNEFENIDRNDFVTKNRYWYMFRNFYEWAKADVYSPCICENVECACGSGSGEEVCGKTCTDKAEKCAQKTLDDLQNRFNVTDNFVRCEKRKECCAQGVGPLCDSPCGCQNWNNHICPAKCTHDCNEPPSPGKICAVESNEYSITSKYSVSNLYSKEFSNKISFSSETKVCCPACSADDCRQCTYQCYLGYERHDAGGLCQSGCSSNQDNLGKIDCYVACCKDKGGTSTTIGLSLCPCHYEARFASSYEFKCTDDKYYIPSKNGPVPLTFIAFAVASYRDPCRCCGACQCPGCGC